MVLNEEKIKLWSRYDKEDGPHSLYGLPRPHHHSRPHDWAAQYSDEESEETHIDTVRDDEDVDEDEDEDEDEVIEIKTPSRRSSFVFSQRCGRRRPQAEHGHTHL